MLKFFKKLKDYWKKINDGEEHTLVDIDVYIPPHIVISAILFILLLIWYAFR